MTGARSRPTLAARGADALRAMAEPLGLPWRAAALDDAAALDAALDGADVVLELPGVTRTDVA